MKTFRSKPNSPPSFDQRLLRLLIAGLLFALISLTPAKASVRGCEEENVSDSSKVYWSAGLSPLSFSIMDQRTVLPVTSRNEKLIVLVHGWNPNGVPDRLNWACEWKAVSSSLVQRLGEVDPSHTWAVAHCNWSRDASTGNFVNPSSGGDYFLDAPKQSARNAADLGREYARALHLRCPNLRQVQFIAHSAGSWLARNAIEDLLLFNPLVVAQLTLLDPFIPGEYSTGSGSSGLTLQAMTNLGYLPGTDFPRRIWRLENYWADDAFGHTFHKPTYGTNTVSFGWPSSIGLDARLDRIPNGDPYDYHSGPVLFYGDTIKAYFNSPIIHPDLSTIPGGSAQWRNIGVSRALWANQGVFPQITSSTPSDTKIYQPIGQTATMEVRQLTQLEAVSIYQWYRLEQRSSGSSSKRKVALAGKTSRSLQITVGTAATEYVCEIYHGLTPESLTYSRVFTVAPDNGAAPPPLQVNSMLPGTLSADVAGGQAVALSGSGFAAGMTIHLEDPLGSPTTITQVNIASGSQLTTSFNVSGKPGIWRVFAISGGTTAPAFSFIATSTQPVAVPATLSRIAIEGLPTNLLEGFQATATVHAFWSNGSKTQVPPSFFGASNLSVVTLGALGMTNSVSAAQVETNTEVIFTARFTSGGVQKEATHNMIILNNTSGGGVVTGDIVQNGAFTGTGNPWVPAGYFNISSTYSFGGHTGGYAWLATSAGGRGNNLYGSIRQTISLPSNANSLKLKFVAAVSLDEAAQATSGDYLEVSIRNTDQTGYVTLRSINPVSDPGALGAWKAFEIDLTAYKGQTKDLIFGGVTNGTNAATWRVDDVQVEVGTAGPILMELAIEGPSLLKENTVGAYRALARLSDNTNPDVTTLPGISWYVNENGTINAGQFTASEVIGERTARVTATYSTGGITKTAQKDVTILNVAPVPVSLTLTGPSEMDENSAAQLFAVVQYSTGARYDVTSTTNWTGGNAAGTPDNGGYLRTLEVETDQTVPIAATFSAEGVEVTSSLVITVKNRRPTPIPVGLAIYGPASVAEGSFGTYDAEVTYNDGTKAPAAATWQEDSRFTTVSATGLLFASDILSPQSVNLTAAFTSAGATVNAAKAIQINDVRATVAKPEIIMPAVIEAALDRPATIVVQTSEPATSGSVTGLPEGLSFDPVQFAIVGTPAVQGTFELNIAATNDFGTAHGIVLLTISGDSGPEWIRFKRANVIPFNATKVASDGQGGCYLADASQIAHRTAGGVIEWQKSLPFEVMDIGGSEAGLLVATELRQAGVIDGISISKSATGEKDAVLLRFSASGSLLWFNRCFTSSNIVNSMRCVLNSDGVAMWGLGIFKDCYISSSNGSLYSLDMADRSGTNRMDAAVVSYRADGSWMTHRTWGGSPGSQEWLLSLNSSGTEPVVGLYSDGTQLQRKRHAGHLW